MDGIKVVVGIDEGSNLLVQVGDLLLEGLEDGVEGRQGGFGTGGAPAVGLFGAGEGQLPAAGDQGLEFHLFFRAFDAETGFGQAGELGQDSGVDGVGLGQLAQAFGEVADFAGVDQRSGEGGIEKSIEEGAFGAAGGFQDNQGGGRRLQGGDELLDAGGGVVEAPGLAGGIAARQVQVGLGDIDSDEEAIGGRIGHGVIPWGGGA